MAKVLLIAPPFYRLMRSHYNGLDLGLSYIASFLRQNGHEAIIYNADFYDDDHYLDQRRLFANFDHFKIALDNLEHPIWREVRFAIGDIAPDFIGIQVYTGTFMSARNVAVIAREVDPVVKIIAGGTHPTLDPVGTVRSGIYDYVVRGEGEQVMLDIVNNVDPRRIKSLTFMDSDGKVVNNDHNGFIEDLDSLPFPMRDGFYPAKGKVDVGAIVTSRGCPFECTYCASPRIWERKVRYRSVDNVLAELEYMVNARGVELVRFQDDTFTLNKARTMEVLDKMMTKGLNVKWLCDTRIDVLDEEMLKMMKRSGCVRLKTGVESGSDKILKKIKKGISVDQVKRTVKLVKSLDIPLTAYFMIGFPGETDEDIKKTISLADEINADYNSLSIVAPYFGTQVYKDLIDSGFDFTKPHWEYFYHQSKEMILNANISKHLIDEFFSLNEKSRKGRI
jgi:anaerobic magnesium-protoporphyrin IX monomethyl ester cyclase